MRFARIALLLLTPALLAGACTTQPTPTPQPRAAYLGVSPAYEDWMREHVHAYWEILPDNGVIPLVYPPAGGLEKVEQGKIELLISAAPPPEGWFAAPLATDAIAIIVHPGVEIDDLSLQQLYDIFIGREENWSVYNGEDLAIQPIIPLQGDELRNKFESDVLHGARFTSNALLAPSPQAALSFVGDKPGSIAIVPWTSLSVKAAPLMLEGVPLTPQNVENERYPLTLNVIALAPEEPVGVMRSFLGWLQASLLP